MDTIILLFFFSNTRFPKVTMDGSSMDLLQTSLLSPNSSGCTRYLPHHTCEPNSAHVAPTRHPESFSNAFTNHSWAHNNWAWSPDGYTRPLKLGTPLRVSTKAKWSLGTYPTNCGEPFQYPSSKGQKVFTFHQEFPPFFFTKSGESAASF